MELALGATANTGSYVSDFFFITQHFQNNDNKEWNGLLGYLDRHEADTICLTYEHLDSRAVFFDYSYPVYNVFFSMNLYFRHIFR